MVEHQRSRDKEDEVCETVQHLVIRARGRFVGRTTSLSFRLDHRWDNADYWRLVRCILTVRGW
jgi:hypothetical protein